MYGLHRQQTIHYLSRIGYVLKACPGNGSIKMAYPPLQGFRLVWVTFSLSLAVFMEVLDTTIANVAAAHCGRLGRGHIARHMGDYFVCRC